MQYLYVSLAMVVVGFIIGWLAKNVIWKDDRTNDILIAVIAAVITGILDLTIVPAIGMSDTMLWIAVALEPPLVALGVLWLVRYANRNR